MRITDFLFSRVGKWSKQYSNLPDSYIKRAMEQVYWRNPKGIQYRANAAVQRKKYHFTMDRPWTEKFRQTNAPNKHHLKRKDKGKQGIIKEIIQERNWVIVKIGDDKEFSGVYVQTEKPLLVTTDVALVDPSELIATSIEWRYTEEGQKVRVSTRSGRIIPIPATAEETIDYKSRSTYKEQPKDTDAAATSEITFEPRLRTFEMDIMESMGIKEHRIPPKSYWY
ncbi:hypothetical protein NQ318_018677 [Aromia moschata]|uniref:Large ribosomal subunit protein uL24 C-terminal domain-containing protein n=1 Tax=Aromia moschata TaxID=1265417 RepID=A0AAV8ZFL4_9CUCU|nr:hypothetical protein NQ318_018677 [Aromia moschata]